LQTITGHQGRRFIVGSFFVYRLNAVIDKPSLVTKYGSGRKPDSAPQVPHFPRVCAAGAPGIICGSSFPLGKSFKGQ
jgi:hypothetical protein